MTSNSRPGAPPSLTLRIALFGAAGLLVAGTFFAARAGGERGLLAGALIAAALALSWLLADQITRRRRLIPAEAIARPALEGLARIDEAILQQLDRVVQVSEDATLKTISRVNGLHDLSSRLIRYLTTANAQSSRMQAEIELNGRIVAELSGFVQRLPEQIALERAHLESLVKEVESLSSITETIRTMARQTEIVSINAAIAAAGAGEAGRGFSVLAGEVRRLATQSTRSALEIDAHIAHLVGKVKERSSGEFERSMRENETEAARLMTLTGKLDESYLDMRQFYGMLLTAVTEHNTDLDRGIQSLLETAQHHDVSKQILDRVHPAFDSRHSVVVDLVTALSTKSPDTAEIDARSLNLAGDYLAREASHRDPDAGAGEAPGEPGQRIELF